MSTPDELIADYLERVRIALAASRCPQSRCAEIVDEISSHMREARASVAPDDEAAARELLDRMGSPEEIAAEAGAEGGIPLSPLGQLAGAAASSQGADGKRRRRPHRWQVEAVAVVVALATITGLSVSLASGAQSGRSFGLIAQRPCNLIAVSQVPFHAAGGQVHVRVTLPALHSQVIVPGSEVLLPAVGGPLQVCASVGFRQFVRVVPKPAR
ncbi:MAG: HAAS signaling domain-containing protein [Acidimicrobiales bacterium]|jgi:hypothetical protein